MLGFLELELTGGCELPYRFWELNLAPVEKQLVLLTAEPSLQPLLQCLKNNKLADDYKMFFFYSLKSLLIQICVFPLVDQGDNYYLESEVLENAK